MERGTSDNNTKRQSQARKTGFVPVKKGFRNFDTTSQCFANQRHGRRRSISDDATDWCTVMTRMMRPPESLSRVFLYRDSVDFGQTCRSLGPLSNWKSETAILMVRRACLAIADAIESNPISRKKMVLCSATRAWPKRSLNCPSAGRGHHFNGTANYLTA